MEGCIICRSDMDDDEYEYKWFWEVDGIYDLDGDLLIWSLMGVGIVSLEEAFMIGGGFAKWMNEDILKQMS